MWCGWMGEEIEERLDRTLKNQGEDQPDRFSLFLQNCNKNGICSGGDSIFQSGI